MHKVLLFAPRGFEDIELAAFTDVLGWTRVLKDVRSLEVIIAAFNTEVQSKHGLIIKPNLLIDNVDFSEYQALIIPGGFSDAGYHEAHDEKLFALIKNIYHNNGIIVAMCVGALVVAETGILEGKKATTYAASTLHDNLETLRKWGADAVKERIVVSDRIITNRGPDTSIEVAFKLIEMLNGIESMKRVRKAMMFD